MADPTLTLARHRDTLDETPALTASPGSSIALVRTVLQAVVTWFLTSPTYTPPDFSHEDANSRVKRIRRAQDAVDELFAPSGPNEIPYTFARFWEAGS